MTKIIKIDAVNTAENKKLRVAAYARVSTGSDEQLISLETQKRHYESYIRVRPDWEYAGLYYDEGISGTSMARRDGFLKMLEDCDNGLIDYIIVKSISRFSRNTVDSVETVRKLRDKGIYIYFEKENIDTGKMEGELLLSILSSLAESESHSISENVKWSVQKRFKDGTFKPSYAPYGYDSVDGQFVVNEEQAEIVREIFNMALSGKSTSVIAKELNERGVPTRRGKTWHPSTVNGMLKNSSYTGDLILQKTYTDDRFKRHINHGEVEKTEIKEHHEPIISRETFDAVQFVIKRNASEKGIVTGTCKYSNRYALSGKIVCGECGGKFKRVKIYNHFGFSCTTHIEDKDKCSMMTIKEEPVKAAFATMMNKLTRSRGKVLMPYLTSLQNTADEHDFERVEKISSLLESSKERYSQIQQFFADGLLDPAIFEREKDLLMDEMNKLKEERNALASNLTGFGEYKDALDNLIKFTVKGRMITKFDDSLFTEHVDHVIVFDRNEIGFAMKCGPVFRERI